jgi:hypothetical protein
VVQTDLAEKKEKKKNLWLSKTGHNMAEVFLKKKLMFSRAWVVSTQNTTKTLRGTMTSKKNKMFSHLVEISSTLEQLRKDLVEKGSALQKLLDAKYPKANAVCSAVGEIQHLLENQRDDICDVWVSAHVKVGDKKRLISDEIDVRKVSYIIDCLLRPCIFLINLFLCLGDVASNPQLRASVIRSLRA